ncbi:helix-turn-helix transcriptional regulator [Pantoea alhagi]|uniref:helix-turn-helix transcriptional regulator n=1 Tax=Pantoea alhagi TaxID=1891675 RepID=UPI00202AE50C|nr:PAS and helix-turn-helix domain-containing protein [Pantoea alhagi]URQ59919.1 helix-turn-helix transcriptional regulator [Pantoea alhagi]
MPANDENFSGLIAMMKHLKEPWGIKDQESRHVYMNQAALLYTGTPSGFDITGKLDAEFPVSWAECADDLQEHDRRTEASRGQTTVIETHYWFGKAYLTPWVSEKLPIYNSVGDYIGVIWNAKPLNSLSPHKYINQQKPSVLITDVSSDLFTQSELDIIFFMLQRLSVKEIAKIYNISPKTIQNRIYNIYQKADVHSLAQFEEYCSHAQLDSYIPYRLLEKGIQFI